MSHFTVCVLLPNTLRGEAKINAAIKKAMAPYDENMEVAPYLTSCYCLGDVAIKDAHAYAHKVVGNREAMREAMQSVRHLRYMGEPIADEEAELEARWQTYWETVEDRKANHPMLLLPDPACEDCKGTGQRKTTYNPKSKWDWYCIGGRWDGDLAGLEEAKVDPRTGHGQLAVNTAPIAELLQRLVLYVPFAVVTPDGEWHQKGRMGWWGMVANEQRQEVWNAKVRELYERYPDHDVVLLDAHI